MPSYAGCPGKEAVKRVSTTDLVSRLIAGSAARPRMKLSFVEQVSLQAGAPACHPLTASKTEGRM